MSRLPYAKMPSRWARKEPEWFFGEFGPEGYVEVPGVRDEKGNPGWVLGSLHELQWRRVKGGGTAAILILFALSIISNQKQRRDGLRKDDTVAATYEEIQAVLPISRALVARGLMHLKRLGAITVQRDGRRSIYALAGIDEPGEWCELPQAHLLERREYLQRLQHFVNEIKNPRSLHAMKLYMLLLAFRANRDNIARMSYDHIKDYTGLRREDTALAIQALIGAGLVRIVSDEEKPRRKGDAMHNRYFILGLAAA
ncbi:hypothetical protein [Massilia sp. TS11]|uniref:hypothetical protein n=1 Tax=Massilia sp. TS11 TaxID=2908003 RepID=UPI001EDA005A|nr:hypothetical protein [Massilia sp. TS11]MCG2585835.1 hypothetical protein [Massilia sp. TS11]